MSEDPLSPQPSRPQRSKTQLACDTCRRRKSRCDGARPSCGHCLDSGAVCHYRTTPANLEVDTSVLFRLTDVESRIEALESRMPADAPSSRNKTQKVDLSQYTLPEFHHGSNHKILHYWSRLRIKLTIPKLNVLGFVKETEQQDLRCNRPISPEQLAAPIPLSHVQQALQNLEDNIYNLPIALIILLKNCYIFRIERIFSQFAVNTLSRRDSDTVLHACDLSLEQLLVLTIAFKFIRKESFGWIPSTDATTEICFVIALQSFWRVHLEQSSVAIQLLLAFAYNFLVVFHQPCRSMAMLNIIDPIIDKLIKDTEKSVKDPTIAIFNELFYILQSDILSEVDGLPTMRAPTIRLPVKIDDAKSSNIQTNQTFQFASSPESEINERVKRGFQVDLDTPANIYHSLEYYFSVNLWLRACQNRILTSMFVTHRAYCTPQDVGSIVAEISSDLHSWYRSLPLDLQFVRDAKSFGLLLPATPVRLKELALRYYQCIVTLNRPILYFVLYRDFEHSARDLEHSARLPDRTDAERQLDPWVFASCYDCVENAKLIVLTLTQSLRLDGAELNWRELHLLLGSFAVLLSVQISSPFASTFRDVNEINRLLDSVEELLSVSVALSPLHKRILEVVLNLRWNVESSSPMATVV